ncbi:hypothetical protein [Pseudomonas sp.]|uniref:hypothetical protein n=1 Tax=Pseudomonas sp. TaxID=306 RepID=UPI004053D218
MRITPTGKAEQQLLALMQQSGVNSPTHLINLLLNYITTTHSQEAVIYAQQHNKRQKEV